MVREGYKMTELGEIPGEWEVKSINEVFEIVGGMSISRAKLGEGDAYYLHYGDIHKSTKGVFSTFKDKNWLPKIDTNEIKVKENAILNTGDIVFADASEDYDDIGKNVVVDVPNKGDIFIAGLHTIIAKDTKNELDNKYKKYCFKTYDVKKQLKVLATGSTVLGISRSNILKVKFLKPLKKEQQKIADILSTIDEQLEQTDQLIEKTKELKKGLMQQLLTKGIGHTEFKQTEIGEIPVEWEVKNIKEIADIRTGKKDTKDRIENGQYPFFVRSQTIERINTYSYDGEAVLTAGDGVGVGKVFHHIIGKFDYHQRVYKISEFENVLGKYFYYYFKKNFLKQAMKYNAKTSVDSVRMEMIANMKLPIPPIKEQQKIADILSSVDDQIEEYTTKKEKLEQLKKGLMQQLLTGKIRVNV